MTSLPPGMKSPTERSIILRGRDPDNLPLVFVCYDDTKTFGADYYRAIAELFYSLDV